MLAVPHYEGGLAARRITLHTPAKRFRSRELKDSPQIVSQRVTSRLPAIYQPITSRLPSTSRLPVVYQPSTNYLRAPAVYYPSTSRLRIVYQPFAKRQSSKK